MRKRLVSFLLGLANFIVVVGAGVGAQVFLKGRVPDVVALSLGTGLLVALYIAGSRWIERRTPIELRLASSVSELLQGFAVGVVLFSTVMGILALLGMYRLTGWSDFRPLGIGLLFALAAAVFEEVMFRGFLFRIFAALGGNWLALAVTACLFGLAHRANPSATWTSSAAIAIEAGILLGAAYAATGTLWFPIGLHAAWNFTEGPIFGMAISGNTQVAGLIGGKLDGPTILTGGSFGPEASVVAVGVCLVAAVYFLRKMKAPGGEPSNLVFVQYSSKS